MLLWDYEEIVGKVNARYEAGFIFLSGALKSPYAEFQDNESLDSKVHGHLYCG